MSVSAQSNKVNLNSQLAPMAGSNIGKDAASCEFARRHIGPGDLETKEMLDFLGYPTVDALTDEAVPRDIRLQSPLKLPSGKTEAEVLKAIRDLAQRNRILRSYIGMGYYGCFTPAVLQRNMLENPGWYTQYTPYQAEVSQGRLEALLTFQTMVIDLTGLDVANASLLDEGTAAAEAMTMCHGFKPDRLKFFVSAQCHPQTIDVVHTRAKVLGFETVVGDFAAFQPDASYFGALVQYPDTTGAVHDYSDFVERAHAAGVMVVVVADVLSLTLLRPPGEFGADIAVGNTQRFGIPFGFGGPHAAYFATRDAFKRHMPGRIIGVSKDSRGRPAYRLSLQTREQHIRREKATSNICTAQALLANIAAMYACYHGPRGLRAIAERVHRQTKVLASELAAAGHEVGPKTFFDTIWVTPQKGRVEDILANAETHGINLRRLDNRRVGISLDETVTEQDLADLLHVFGIKKAGQESAAPSAEFEAPHRRTSSYLQHPVFNRYHSETEMMRYLKRLESRDLSLTTSMIPLGSCTMKLNAAAEMFPITWPEFAGLHPFAPRTQAAGYNKMFEQLESWLAEITGFSAVSLQPNAGSQGEYTGLLVLRAYHQSRGQGHRDICLIPASAHGTNPASAVMAGLKVVPVLCDKRGNIDVADLRAKAESHKDALAALMVTYPSTHGVFEETIKEICRIIHANGGQVYMDGANLNAQVGLCRPGAIGADVCHMNLHKTFCIPHGGGGPGMGPIAVASHLASFLPGHVVTPPNGRSSGAVASAAWGSASILPISWVYIAAMGPEGLTKSTQYAILNANYIARRLEKCFPVLYRGQGNLVAHECILDFRHYKTVTVEDVAKRLMDFGFHAPTISWPVPGTVMVEPTESESKQELDRFCDAMIAIHAEIEQIESGRIDKLNNPLKNAPHTADMIAAAEWNHPYSREQACYPAKWLHDYKFWPAVGRIDNVFGDRNLVCSCVGMEAFS